MKIIKGDWFRCIKDSLNGFAKKGEYYQTEMDGRLRIAHSSFSTAHAFYTDSWKDFFIKLYTIQDLKDGKVAVVNDGTVEELNEVLNFSLKDVPVSSSGEYKYYIKERNHWSWLPTDDTDLPTQSVKDFLVQLPKEEDVWEPKVGEKVEFKHYFKHYKSSYSWREAEYLATDKKSRYPYVVVETNNHGDRSVAVVSEIRQIPKVVIITRQEIADRMGVELNQLEIIN